MIVNLLILMFTIIMYCVLCNGYYYNQFNKLSNFNQYTRKYLVPLTKDIPLSILKEISNNNNNNNDYQINWDFYLLEMNDIKNAVEATIKTFYKPRLILNMDNMTGIEKIFWTSVDNAFQSLDKGDYYNNVFLGFLTRSGKRLKNPSLDITPDSLILVAKPKDSQQIAGLVEILLEKPEGNIAPSIQFFKFPITDSDEPYLCNLCVLNEHRRKGLGTTLCKICEYIAQKYWKRNIMYLHVEDNNEAALAMYLSMGYRLTPGLSLFQSKLLGMDRIQYYKKSLNVSKNDDDDDDDDYKSEEEGFLSGLLSNLDSKIGSNMMKYNGQY